MYQRFSLKLWSYYKTGLRPTKFGLGLVSYDPGVGKFEGAFRRQLRTTQCRLLNADKHPCLHHTVTFIQPNKCSRSTAVLICVAVCPYH